MPNVDYLADDKPLPGIVPRHKSEWRRALLDNASETAIAQWVNAYEDASTEHTPDIIKENPDFFKRTAAMDKIVTIGHSLAEVDQPYFMEIVRWNHGRAAWWIGYHSSGDIVRALDFVDRMGLEKNKVTLFRT